VEPLPKAGVALLSPWTPGFFDLFLFSFIVTLLIALILFLTSHLGVRSDNPEKMRPYESGVIPTGSARFRFPVPFYLVAVYFLIFDLEAAFIFAWAVAFKPLGIVGWVEMSVFIVVLLISLVYLWAKGGLEWGPAYRKN
jgi:NADH-quinone oxidoreductase subunit A